MAEVGDSGVNRVRRGKWPPKIAWLLVLLVMWFVPPFPYRSFHEASTQEAGLREMIGDSELGDVELIIEGRPASRSFMTRLGDLRTRPRSAEIPSDDMPSPRICSVGRPRWRNAITVEMDASSYESVDASVKTVFILKLTAQGWRVVDQEETIVARVIPQQSDFFVSVTMTDLMPRRRRELGMAHQNTVLTTFDDLTSIWKGCDSILPTSLGLGNSSHLMLFTSVSS